MTYDEFLISCAGTKRPIYRQAIESLMVKPYHIRDSYVKMFIKAEHLKNIPRAIQTRSPRYHTCLGRYTKAIEHKIIDGINDLYDPTGSLQAVAKGLNLDQWAHNIHSKWHRIENPVALVLDVSRFDQHINEHLQRFEHEIIEAFSTGVCNDSSMPDLRTLLRQQIHNQGAYRGVDGTVRYRVIGGRMSGDMNTSLGNVIVFCMLAYSYFKEHNIEHELFDNGDDCVVILNAKDVQRVLLDIEDWFRDCGISLRIEDVCTNIHDITFCQQKLCYVDEIPRMVPLPGRRLYNDLTTDKQLNSFKMWRKWLGAVAGGGASASSGLPIYQEFYKWLSKSTTPYTPKEGDMFWRYRDQYVEGMTYKCKPISIQTRWSFYSATRITPKEQLKIEQIFRDASPLEYGTEEKAYYVPTELEVLIPSTLVTEHS